MSHNLPTTRKGSPLLFRCLAAWSVFHSHQFAIHGLPEPGISQFGLSLGGIGIYTFFALSGYYVTGSYLNRFWWDYIRARVIRVWPALIVAVALTTIALGCLSTLGLRQFWQHPDTLAFLKQNMLLGFFPMAKTLPGVLTQNPLPLVNASLWTLPYVWMAYALVPLLWLRKLWPFWVVIALLTGLLGLAYLQPHQYRFEWGYHVDLFYAVVFTMVFFTGVGLKLLSFKWHLIIGMYAFVAFIFGWMVGYVPLVHWACIVLWVIAVLWLCTRFHIDRHISQWGDPSYGLYLYAFVVQQVCYQFLAGQGFVLSYGVGFAVTLILAYASWHWVEKPLLKWRPQWKKPSMPSREPRYQELGALL